MQKLSQLICISNRPKFNEYPIDLHSTRPMYLNLGNVHTLH